MNSVSDLIYIWPWDLMPSIEAMANTLSMNYSLWNGCQIPNGKLSCNCIAASYLAAEHRRLGAPGQSIFSFDFTKGVHFSIVRVSDDRIKSFQSTCGLFISCAQKKVPSGNCCHGLTPAEIIHHSQLEENATALLKAMGPRPSWLPMPPIETLFPRVGEDPQKSSKSTNAPPEIMLVSTAIGQSFEAALLQLEKTAKAAGGFSRTWFWRSEAEVMTHAKKLAASADRRLVNAPATHPNASVFESLGQSSRSTRPFCGAYKPLQMWLALLDLNDGDYVMWVDATRLHNSNHQSVVEDVRLAIRTLRSPDPVLPAEKRPVRNASSLWSSTPWFQSHVHDGWAPRDVRSAYGLLYCGAGCPDSLNSSEAAWAELFDDDTDGNPGKLSSRPHVLDSNLLLENNAANRLFVWDWLSMALAKPKEWCQSEAREQAAFSALARSRRLPLLSTCAFPDGCDSFTQTVSSIDLRKQAPHRCSTATRNMNFFLAALARGAFDIVNGTEYGMVKPVELPGLYAPTTSSSPAACP
jgi:hypothetical protein